VSSTCRKHRHYTTSTDTGYLPRFLALHESMERHCTPYTLWVLALDNKALNVVGALPNVSATPLASIENERLLRAKANRTRIEYIWTVKPSFMYDLLLGHPGMPHIAHVGADCYFFNNPEPVFTEIGDAPVGIVPHRFSPECQPLRAHPGLYNGDFIYVSRGAGGLAFIRWFASACIEWCYWRHEVYQGRPLYVDQKWLNDAPAKWGAHVIQHKGAHLSPWNQRQYHYEWRGKSIYVGGQPLLWYHFHKGLQHGFPRVHPFVERYIYGAYREALRRRS